MWIRFTGVHGLHDTGLAVHNRQSEVVNLAQLVAVTVGLVEEDLGLCVVMDAGCVNISSSVDDVPGKGSLRKEKHPLNTHTTTQALVCYIYLLAA